MQSNATPIGNRHHRLWMYQAMVQSRELETRIKTIYFEGKLPVFNMAKGPIPGEMHLSVGQEPCAVGVCAHLRPSDFVTATHRPHHVAIAKGVNLRAMAAEIFGKETGLSHGLGGHMHLFDASVNFSCSGIIGEGIAPAVGAAVAMKIQGRDDIAVSFMGEGATNQGQFHEALNLASLWKAPVVFIIEDNAYGISVSKAESTSVASNADRAAAYGMPGVFVPGNDPDAIYEAAGEAVARARAGGGPTLIELETHRLEGHFVGDTVEYRPPAELESLATLDPITLFRARLEADGHDGAELNAIEAEAISLADDAIAFARNSEYPAAREAFAHVFA
ncbi:thiamine pyrophosphate-dependent dehydrogenase E1 component subunit alpha [Sphingomonas paeninsulae]|nr:thiamine pyrophosphate-dependent dehydrogenase E1 component subunit alpha [Sphingomonas paeninsulae]